MIYEVLYIGFDGIAYDRNDIEKSFYLNTGKKAHDYESEFIRFIDGCFGKSIKEYYPATFINCVKFKRKMDAIYMFRKANDCSLLKAKEFVEGLMDSYHL